MAKSRCRSRQTPVSPSWVPSIMGIRYAFCSLLVLVAADDAAVLTVLLVGRNLVYISQISMTDLMYSLRFSVRILAGDKTSAHTYMLAGWWLRACTTSIIVVTKLRAWCFG